MELIKLNRTISRKGVWAIYSFEKHKMDVYLRHNVPCKKEWGDMHISAYVKPNSNGREYVDIRTFDNYASFRRYRSTIAGIVNKEKQ